MAERDAYPPGVPSWVDHASRDPETAVRFYEGLFGWEATDAMPPDAPGHYFMCRLRGRDVTAVGSQQSADAPAMWNTYVAVADADAAVERARAAGGAVLMEPFDVFDAGRMAVLADPTGAVVCVWQAGRHPGAGLVNETGTLGWNELLTRDPDAARRFYRAVFGWQATSMPFEGGEYTLWHPESAAEPSARTAIGGMMPMSEPLFAPDVPPNWLVYFIVDDTDAAVATASGLGGTVTAPAFDTDVGRIAVLADPLGAQLAVITPAPSQG